MIEIYLAILIYPPLDQVLYEFYFYLYEFNSTI